MLIIIGYNHFTADLSEGSLDTSEEILPYLTLGIAGLHEILHDAVLQRVVGDDGESSAFAEQSTGAVLHLFQGILLMVHLDTKCLEQFGGLFLLPLTREELFRDL